MVDVVYRYRPMANEETRERTLDILKNQQLYCAAPSSFNDPFEIACDLRFDADPDTKVAVIHKLDCRVHRMKNVPLSPEFQRDHLENIPSFEKYFRLPPLDFGLVSFSNKLNCILLWSHYADSHKGICIEFSRTKSSHNLFFDELEEVKYVRDLPIVNVYASDEIKEFQKIFVSKSNEWAYEGEYRYLMPFSMVERTNRYLKLPQGVISAIYLGCKIAEEDERLILGMVNSKKELSNTKVFKAKMSNTRYALDFHQVK